MNDVEILIITHRRASLERCLRSIVEHTDAPVHVVVNGANAAIEGYLAEAAARYPQVRFTVLAARVGKSRARNQGLAAARAPVVYFLDDDVLLPGDTAAVLRRLLAAHPGAAVIGGPNLTPPESSFLSRLAGHVLGSPFTAGAMRRRYRPGGREGYCDDRSLILCNLAVRREVLEREKIAFDERLEYNEENLLLEELRCRGYRLFVSPELAVYHERRGTLVSFCRQVASSGRGRAVMSFIRPGSLSLIHVLPAVFLAYLAFVPFAGSVAVLPLAAYLAAAAAEAIRLTVLHRERWYAVPALLVFSISAHLSYGAGFLRGIWESIAWKRSPSNSTVWASR